MTGQSGRDAVLYISYDGMLEPLGQSQVLSYLKKLAAQYPIHLISFEKAHDWNKPELRELIRKEIESARMEWTPLRYHKRPSVLATGYDILRGIAAAGAVIRGGNVRIVHARSYVASVIAVAVQRLFGVKYLFDMRGFWADERVDAGVWPANSPAYRAAKRFERQFLLSADSVVSLTHAAVEEMRRFDYLQQRMPPFSVITTCTDLDLFMSPDDAPRAPGTRQFTLGCVGTVGNWYCFDEVLRCFKLLLEARPDAQLHILNRGEHAYIRERLARHALPPSKVRLEETDRAGVAKAMHEMDAAVLFAKAVYSRTARAPTRLGEFLACGVPCLTNAGAGDMDTILEQEGVGVAVPDFDESSLRTGVGRLVALASEPGVRLRCRGAAVARFSLDTGVRKYADIYQELLGAGGDVKSVRRLRP